MNKKELDEIFHKRDEPISENFHCRVTRSQLQRIKNLKNQCAEVFDRRVVQDVFRFYVDQAAEELEQRLKKHGA